MKDKTERVDRGKYSQKKRADVIAALEEIWSREKARLKASIPQEAAEKLGRFLNEKGLSKRQGVMTLIEYGLSEESAEELERLKSEKESQMNRMWGEHAPMKFGAYEYFTENGALTRRLPLSLSRNRSLKKQLRDKGLHSLVPKDEWDDWKDEEVDSFFRRYVFRTAR